jgi:hypothetical protein
MSETFIKLSTTGTDATLEAHLRLSEMHYEVLVKVKVSYVPHRPTSNAAIRLLCV